MSSERGDDDPSIEESIAVLAADSFEKVELTIPVAALKAAGAEVDIVSLRRGRIRGGDAKNGSAELLLQRR